MAVQEEEVDQVMKPWQTEYQHEWDATQAEGQRLNKKILSEQGIKWPPDSAKTTP